MVFGCQNMKYLVRCLQSSPLRHRKKHEIHTLLRHARVLETSKRCCATSTNQNEFSEYSDKSETCGNHLEADCAVSAKEIESFLKENMALKEGYTNYISTCPRHSLTQLRVKEVDKLYINKRTGYFLCKSCGSTGPWKILKENVDKLMDHVQKRESLPEQCITSHKIKPLPKKVNSFWETTVPIKQVALKDVQKILDDLSIKGLSIDTLSTYGIQVLSDLSGLAIPLYSVNRQLAGVRIVTTVTYKVKHQERTRLNSKTIPNIDCNGLFGLNLVKPCQTELVLTGNEFDAMAVHQQLGACAVALPKGRTLLHQEFLPSLEQFSKIIIYLGGDQHTWDKAMAFTKKLNQERCIVIRPTPEAPNALKALNQGLDLKSILYSGKPVTHKSIVSFQNLRQEVFDEISNAEKLAGVKWKRYPVLNNLLKGHRRGELTVFTGPTGAGKTTFISDYSLDLCTQGVNTLWGSFEINNTRLMKTMLMQYSQRSLVKYVDEFDYWADKFEQLPMYFMTFHGQQNVHNVIETMSHAAYVYDISHVIVDNLQFMMGLSASGNEDRFLRQDRMISDFRKFATTMNCHVTIVIHPRKERDDELSVSSIFGSAKASQEADNVLILQDKRLTSVRGRKYIQLAKNRFDGELGVMLLKFNKDSLSFAVPEEKKRPKLPQDGIRETESEH